MPSPVQREILDQLRKGAALRVRFNKRGLMGDFLLVKGKTIRVVPRRTIAAICRIAPPVSKPVEVDEPSVQPKKTAPLELEASSLLDDLARSLARGKPFGKLSPYEQEHLRSIAARLI